MKLEQVFFAFTLLSLISCSSEKKQDTTNQPMNSPSDDTMAFSTGYSEVNGLKMYYEIYGQGKPLVLLHGGGSTIQTTFGRVIPMLAKNRQVIGVELQAHGRTDDRDTGISFEQDADDVAGLLKNLNIQKADIFGFSNGGTTAIQLAIRHPDQINKIIAASALCKRSGVPNQFWEFMSNAKIEDMPQQLKDAYKAVASDTHHLQAMHDKCAQRMVEFNDIPDELLKSIKAPTLIINGDTDVGTSEHAVEMHRLIPNSQLMIIPGGHGAYIGEIITLQPGYKESDFIVPLIEKFLDQPVQKQ
jgi:pimeloyl-ACP methyl ester carboxylesterase